MRPIRRTFLALAALAGLAGCAKEQHAPGAGPDADGYVTLRATQETPGTRAIIGGADNKSIFWSEGDALSVFDAAGKNEKFNISGGAGTSSGTFRGLFESVPSTYVALHPYQAAVTLSSAEGAYRLGGVVLKSEQAAVAGSFDSAAALMTAQSDDGALGFRNAVGFVKVKPEFDCSKITLVSKSSTDALAGTVELGLASDGTPSVSSVSDASSKVSISGDIKANSTYYIAVLPVTLANGFRLIFTDSTGDRTKETDKSMEIKRSNVKNLGGFATDALDEIPYVTFSAESEQGFSINESTPLQQGVFEYSVGGGAWAAVVCDTEIAFGGSYGDLRLRGKSPNGTALDDMDCSTITFSDEYVSVAASGDIRTLVDWENYSTVDTGNARFCWLFYENSMLTSAPELPATKLADCCYMGMFFNCSELTAAPKLPATELADYCYQGMFENCESLGTAPALPATSLKKGCYSSMFRGCNSLEKAPELPAETLVEDCYSYMFTDCIYLDEITLKAKDASATDCLTGWVNEVAGLGTFHKYNSLTLPEGDDGIPTGWTIVNHSDDDWNTIVESGGTSSGDSGYLTFKVSGTQTFGMTVASGLGLDGTSAYFEYSTDKGANWTKFSETVSGVSFSDELWLRGISPKGTSVGQNSGQYGIISFGSSGVKVAAGGDIRSLVNYADYKNADTSNARFIGLFMGCEALTSTPDLSSTKLADYCYRWMFMSCASLTKLPDVLPATELAMACYSQMFMNCSSLENVPEGLLPATEFRIVTTSYTAPVTDCYASMFAMCSKLKNAPKLPATILSSQCYMGMFQNCTSLAAAPELKATEMAYGCYYSMFQGCSSLTEAPALPATTLADACYKTMFQNCTSLTKAPELPAETLKEQCYYQMFYGCSKLNEVTIKAKTGGADMQPVNQWLTGVASTGTIHKYQSYTVQSYSGTQIPSGWTVVNHSDSDWNTIAE